MPRVPDISDESVWPLLEDTTPAYDLLSRKPDHHLFWALNYAYIPIRSIFEYPVLTETDISDLSKVIEYNCHLFNMTNPDEERLYCAIKDRIYSGWYVQITEENKWDENNNMLVWLTWAQQYLEVPKSIGDMSNNE